MRRSEFQIAVESLLGTIDDYCSAGKGRHKLRIPLLRGVVDYLVLDKRARALEERPELRAPFRRVMRSCERSVNGIVLRNQIPTFVLLAAQKLSDLRASKELFGRPSPAEGRVVRTLVAAAGLHVSDLAERIPLHHHAALEAAFEQLIAQIDSNALEELLLAALESFVVPKGRRRFTEVYGLCFGTVRETESTEAGVLKRVVQISRVATQIRATATHDSVTPNDRSAKIHLQVADAVFEHLELVGDYHTHPYATAGQCERIRGWEMSEADCSQLAKWVTELKATHRRPRVALVLAVARSKRRGRSHTRRAKNRIRVFVGQYAVHITAYRLQSDGTADEDVDLRIPMNET